MPILPDDTRLGWFLARLRAADTADRPALFQGAVIEAGGDLTLPRAGDDWGPHLVEISLLGIHDAGATLEEVLANWTQRAAEQLEHRRLTGAAEDVVLSGLAERDGEALRRAAERVRLHSLDMAAIAAAGRVEALLAAGRLA